MSLYLFTEILISLPQLGNKQEITLLLSYNNCFWISLTLCSSNVDMILQ